MTTKKTKARRTYSSADIDAWAQEIGTDVPDIQVDVMDLSVSGKARKLGEFINKLPSLKEIIDTYGPGRFRLLVKTPNRLGRLVYVSCRTLDLRKNKAAAS